MSRWKVPAPLETRPRNRRGQSKKDCRSWWIALCAAAESVTAQKIRNFLNGTWLGEPLHVVLTDVPVGAASRLKLEDTPQLTVEHDQVLVKIRDAGVNPIDWKIRAGYLKERMPSAFPLTLGQDFAGEVAELGHGTSGFAPGDRVFGFAQGTYAEYAVALSSTIAAMPESMAFDVAASLPTPGSTAL